MEEGPHDEAAEQHDGAQAGKGRQYEIDKNVGDIAVARGEHHHHEEQRRHH